MSGLRGQISSEVLARVFDWWERTRGTRPAPSRAELDPAAIRFALADLALVEVEQGAAGLRFRYRLVGNNLVTRDGYNMRGKYLEEMPEAEYRRRVQAAWTEVVGSAQPSFAIRKAIFDGRLRRYESLILPLCTGEGAVSHILGIQKHLDF